VDLEQARERIRAYRESNAFISLTQEQGAGVVVAVKDVVDVRGCPTTAGARPMPAVPAEHDAPIITRLRKQGCVIIGKTNLHEFCLGPTSENPHYGSVRNPRDPTRIAGGSSGGSAAAVALDMCDWAVGTDTSGSIRIPAALCGVVGIKPTTGTVDMRGAIPLSRTQDTLGPLATDVRRAAAALELLTGTRVLPTGPTPRAGDLRLAVPEGWSQGLAADVRAAWSAVSDRFRRVQLPDAERLCATGRTIVMFEAAEFHRQRLADTPELYGDDVRELLRNAMSVSRAAYERALLDAAALSTEMDEALSGWDAILAPATRVTATPLGTPVSVADLTNLTRPFSVTGHPVVTLPAPTGGLPVGVQVVGRRGARGAARRGSAGCGARVAVSTHACPGHAMATSLAILSTTDRTSGSL